MKKQPGASEGNLGKVTAEPPVAAVEPETKKIETVTGTAVLINEKGIHARSAVPLIQSANTFESKITLTVEDKTANAKSMLDVLLLAAGRGNTVIIEAVGVDAKEAVSKLKSLIESGFEEI